MKPVLMILASLVLLVLVFLSGVIIAANVISEPEPHKLANVDAPDLWTAKPKPVDTAAQSYARLPDAKPAASETVPNRTASAPAAGQGAVPAQVAAGTGSVPPVDATTTAAINPAGTPASGTVSDTTASNGNVAAGQAAMSPAGTTPSVGTPAGNGVAPAAAPINSVQAQWCYARYRSYRVQDNSYQPYDGSPRRQCQGPADGSGQVAAHVPGQAQVATAGMAQTVATAQQNPSQGQRQIQGQPMADARPQRPVPPAAVPYPDTSLPEDGQPVLVDGPYEPMQQSVDTASPGGSHEEWCHGRYRSYRTEDNSYQPFEGGPRRQCQSPFG